MRRRKFLKKSIVLKNTTNRREYHILYDRWIHIDYCCPICSKRVGEWVDCWKSNDNEYDNPKKSWKYRFKKRKQWMTSEAKR